MYHKMNNLNKVFLCIFYCTFTIFNIYLFIYLYLYIYFYLFIFGAFTVYCYQLCSLSKNKSALKYVRADLLDIYIVIIIKVTDHFPSKTSLLLCTHCSDKHRQCVTWIVHTRGCTRLYFAAIFGCQTHWICVKRGTCCSCCLLSVPDFNVEPSYDSGCRQVTVFVCYLGFGWCENHPSSTILPLFCLSLIFVFVSTPTLVCLSHLPLLFCHSPLQAVGCLQERMSDILDAVKINK